MNYSKVKDPQWANLERTAINCMVDFHHVDEEWSPFTAVATGDYLHSHEIFELCKQGKFGPVADYVPPYQVTDEQIAASARIQRDKLLVQSDWTQLPDVPESTKNSWLKYRQDLRDVTLQDGFPNSIIWPIPPSNC